MIARLVRITGIVQGVGFRPYVWRLARELGLLGWVRNDAAGVELAVEGEDLRVAELLARLGPEAPPLARVDGVKAIDAAPQGYKDFRILESGGGAMATLIGPDTAPCAACLQELFDPAGRRWRHAFITCTHCGPRYTVTRRLPYDRPQTSLAPFPLCTACASEYTDPADRRFHAETTCCPACGPQLQLLDASGQTVAGDAIVGTLARLLSGAIVAVKGLGGFHLMCDARNEQAVARLRERKAREEKPFAVLFANRASVEAYAVVGADEAALLESPERPIVLLHKMLGMDEVLPGLAPGLAWLGAMLPATPIQFLLFHEAADRPAGGLQEAQALALVCTSANPGGEPLVTANAEALARLCGIADAYLLHDRDIVVRCDDSVLRVESQTMRAAGAVTTTLHSNFLRRARGFTPRAIRLPMSGPSLLAVGGWFKNTVCVTRGDEAFVSQHVGDLDNAATCGFFEETVAHLLHILQVEPAAVAFDLHPDFHSSRFGAALAAERGLPVFPVQHHHAHVAATLAEHGHRGPVLGLALDGVGLGSDGAPWGGELLRLEGGDCRRLSHLSPLPLPGGDRAAREPWRMAAAALHVLGRGEEIPGRFPHQAGAGLVAQMLERGLRTPSSSSMGRLFDAAAGLLAVRPVAGFEGQAAMLLEGLADAHGATAAMAGGWRIDAALDFAPLLAALADCQDVGIGAALFHATLTAGLADWVSRAAAEQHLDTLALGGGCFLNAILASGLQQELSRRGLKVLVPRQLPPNDGGLSLGQAWVAMQHAVVPHPQPLSRMGEGSIVSRYATEN